MSDCAIALHVADAARLPLDADDGGALALSVASGGDVSIGIGSDGPVGLSIEEPGMLSLETQPPYIGGGGAPYSGEYTVTPTQSQQTLRTAGKSLVSNVVIEPIPSNYGLITWNGSTLMVS